MVKEKVHKHVGSWSRRSYTINDTIPVAYLGAECFRYKASPWDSGGAAEHRATRPTCSVSDHFNGIFMLFIGPQVMRV